MKQKRLYLQYCEKSLNAVRSAIAAFNSPYDSHKVEITLILLTNAWELVGKAILIHSKESIVRKDVKGSTISAEQIVYKLQERKILDEIQSAHLQQVISLRNEAVHGLLPDIPVEILHHLFYFSCKFYKDIILDQFRQYRNFIEGNYLSISFSDLTTYADKVQKVVSRFRRGSDNERKIVWLLERGIRFDGHAYIPQVQFEHEFKEKAKWKLLPHLHIGKFLKNAEMVRIVPVQAPKNYTADIILRKGKQSDAGLPVVIKKTDVERDYPYLTGELAKKLGKKTQFISYATKKLGIRNKQEFHQEVRASKSGRVQRYSDASFNFLKEFFKKNPDYDPYH